jgi:hypothetical protein
MPNLLKDIFSGATKGVLDGVNGIVDNVVTNKEEKTKLRNELTKILTENANIQEQEISKRLQYDMSSDSWLAKNIRPLSLVFTTLFVFAIAATDGNIGQFKINTTYIDLFKSLLMVQYSFYFGSRALTKSLSYIDKFDLKLFGKRK